MNIPRWLKAALVAARHGRLGLPWGIGIELSTACNRRCWYCPQSKSPMRQQIVSEELWQLFLWRLQEVKWRGLTSLIYFNELALVPNSERYVADLVEVGTKPILFSNGDFPDSIAAWCQAGCRSVLVTEHPPFRPGWMERLRPVLEAYPRQVKVRRLENPDNRAGVIDVPFRVDKCTYADGMTVRVDGTVGMCCMDYFHTQNYGSILKQPLLDIWFSERYRRDRRLVQSGKAVSALCRACMGR